MARWSRLTGTLVLGVGLAASVAAPAFAADSGPTVTLSRVAARLPPGKVWAQLQEGWLCAQTDARRGTGELQSLDLGPYAAAFAAAFPQTTSGWGGERPNLFEAAPSPSAADYQVAALIHDADVRACEQGIMGVRNNASVDIEWQIYSTSQGRVVAHIETSAQSSFRSRNVDVEEAFRRAIADNFAQLAMAPEMVDLLSAPVAPTLARQQMGSKLTLTTSSNGRPPAEAVGAVLLVSLGASFGSGVLISTDGYVLTNEHVVGAANAVRLRWSDGLETVGEVVKSHRARDVALIKTDPRGREPLGVRASPVQPGERVIAIGAPLEQQLQGTITSGVVSANRVIDGFSYIQSDVGVNQGNSGGPLLDEEGYVIGLTVHGLARNDAPVGLNFFIPIKDALDFLDLEVAPTALARE